jgi:DNA-binding transcriptional ArsR family regulator/YHS domain-containing protein
MYSQVFNLHAELLKAMAHPKRLEIIHLLRNQELSVGEIQVMLDLQQANLSQHLQVLREAGVVRAVRQGKQMFYRLAHSNFIQASDLLRTVLIERYEGSELADELTTAMTELLPLTTDPVCQMRLSPKTAAFVARHDRTNYYFCASGCLEAFNKESARYVISQKTD